MNIWPVTGSIKCVTGQNSSMQFWKTACTENITDGIKIPVMILP